MKGGPLTQLHRTTCVPAEQTALPRDQQHHDDAGMGSAGQLHGAADQMHTVNCLALQQGMGNGVKGKLERTPNPTVPVCNSLPTPGRGNQTPAWAWFPLNSQPKCFIKYRHSDFMLQPPRRGPLEKLKGTRGGSTLQLHHKVLKGHHRPS